MQTKPAPLDAFGPAGALDEFRITGAREIQAMLKQLHDGAVLLTLHAGDGATMTSALWTMDSARGVVGFNADPTDPALGTLLKSDEVAVVGYLDSIKLQFAVRGLLLVQGQRASVVTCAFPREMYRFQRRNAFRVRPPLRNSPVARFMHPDAPELELQLRVADVSIGGLGLFLPVDQPSISPGVVIQRLAVELDDETRIEASARLQHVTDLGADAKGVRLGLEFVRVGNEELRVLQRFIDLTQKRAKMMALG